MIFQLIFGYTAYYFNRTQLTLTIPLLVKSGVDKSTLANMLSIGYATFAIGRLVHGHFIDKHGGVTVFKVNLLLSVMCTILFTQTEHKTLIWACGRFFQAAGYTSMVDIIHRNYSDRQQGKVLGLASLSYNLGDGFIRLLLGGCMSLLKDEDANVLWVDIFNLAAFFSLLFGLPALVSVHENIQIKTKTLQPSFKALLTSVQFWLLCLMCFGLTFIREVFLSWTVQYLTDDFKIEESHAAMFSLVFPLFGAVSSLLSGFMIDTVPDKKRFLVTLSFLLCCTMSMMLLPQNLESALVIISLTALVMMAPFTLVSGYFAVEYGTMAVGAINAVGNIGAIIAGQMGRYSYEKVWQINLMVALLSLFAASFLKKKTTSNSNESD